jgi:hypothetical protein
VETGHFRDQLGAALFEVGNGWWHSTLLLLNTPATFRIMPQKRN